VELDAAELGRLAMDGLEDVPADLQGSAAYRTRVGAAMVARAWTTATSEANGGAHRG
jgi:carbon-monoxide dehydrogenase medium subunit